jgi:TRAP-type C4-dicarboxylate transport system substrate-binding protein
MRFLYVCAAVSLSALASAKTASGADVRVGVASGSANGPFISSITKSQILEKKGARAVVVTFNNERQLISSLLEGGADVGLVTFDALTQADLKDPPRLATIFTRPLLLETEQDISDVQNAPLGSAVLADINRTGLVPLTFWNRGSARLITANQLIAPSDLRGLRVIAERQNETTAQLTHMGAVYESRPANAMASFSQGKVAILSLDDRGPAMGAAPTAKSYFVTPVRPLVGVFVASPAFWSSLTEDDREDWSQIAVGAYKDTANDASMKVTTGIAVREYLVRPLQLDAKQKYEALKSTAKDSEDLLRQINLVEETLSAARAQRSKKRVI